MKRLGEGMLISAASLFGLCSSARQILRSYDPISEDLFIMFFLLRSGWMCSMSNDVACEQVQVEGDQ